MPPGLCTTVSADGFSPCPAHYSSLTHHFICDVVRLYYFSRLYKNAIMFQTDH